MEYTYEECMERMSPAWLEGFHLLAYTFGSGILIALMMVACFGAISFGVRVLYGALEWVKR